MASNPTRASRPDLNAGTILEHLPEALLAFQDGSVVWSNPAAVALVGAAPEGRSLAALLEPGGAERLARHLERKTAGLPEAMTLRLLFSTPTGPVPAEVRVVEPSPGELLLCAREATASLRAETLVSKLAQLAGEGQASMDVQQLLEGATPIFAALGWRGVLLVAEGGRVRPLHILAPPGAALGLARDAREGPFSLEALPLTKEALASGRPLLVDDVPGEVQGRLGSEAGLTAALDLEGRQRGAYVPIRGGEGRDWVLAVFGEDVGEHAFVAIQLFAAQLAATARLQRLSADLVKRERLAAVGEMSAVLAHEVRNPLGVIFNVAVALRRALGEDAQAARLLTMLEEEADRLKRIVSELLELARPTAPEPRALDARDSVHKALAALPEDPAFAPQVELPPRGCQVLADPVLLRRALAALLANARDHRPAGAAVRVTVASAGDRVRFTIFNEGPPIPPERRDRIFEPFFTTKPAGTGLGLTLARRIVEDLGGRLALDERESGVSFSLELPAAVTGPEEAS